MAGITQLISWAALLTIIRGFQAQLNSSLDSDRCFVASSDMLILYGWAREDEGLEFSDRPAEVEEYVTATVITTVNTVLNSTAVTTKLPQKWASPPTNAAGTRIHVFESNGTNVTLTFPTASIEWPREYSYCANDLEAKMYCLANKTFTTESITTPPPQPTKPLNFINFNEVDPNGFVDPKGLLANPVIIAADGAWHPVCSHMLGPYYPAFKCQSSGIDGPVWGGLDKTWMEIVTSTLYTNADSTSLPK